LFRELLSRETRLPPILGVGLAAVLMGSVAVATAQASLPSRQERVAAEKAAVVEARAADAAAIEHASVPKFFFVSPLAGHPVNSPFGLRKMPWEEGGRLHQGIDIAAPSGSAVRATMGGVVLRSGVDGGYGRFIEVRHTGGLTSLYAHLGRVAPLKAGTVVKAGQVVGYVGSSGRSTGAHLHFEIRHDGKPLNPVVFLGRTFKTEADLPLKLAAQFPRRVRVAQVSSWPERLLARKASSKDSPVVAVASTDGRVRAVIKPAPPALGPTVEAPRLTLAAPPAAKAPAAPDEVVATAS
jgi:murein DD-endopeptidase MepM/ murein hydrolase activator NlpD